jgi:hypothetical protein
MSIVLAKFIQDLSQELEGQNGLNNEEHTAILRVRSDLSLLSLFTSCVDNCDKKTVNQLLDSIDKNGPLLKSSEKLRDISSQASKLSHSYWAIVQHMYAQ